MIDLTVRGLSEVRAKMARRHQRIGNLRGAYLKAAILVESWTLQDMQAQGRKQRPASLVWPPLKASTIRSRERIGKWPGRMLQVTGRLKAGFTHNATNRRGQVRNTVRYAAYHEEGTRKMARRKIFPTPEHGRKVALPALQDHVKRAIR